MICHCLHVLKSAIGTSGKAIFTNLRQRSSEFTPRITIIRKDNVQFVDFHPVRNLRLGNLGTNFEMANNHESFII